MAFPIHAKKACIGQAFTTRSLRGAQTDRLILNAFTQNLKLCLKNR